MGTLSKSILSRLEFQHETIHELIHGLSDKDVKRRLDANKWSIGENIAHLGRYQEIFRQRTKEILSENKPQFDRYKAENDELFEPWLKMPIKEAIDNIIDVRAQLFHSVHNLTDLGLNRVGKHPKLGWMDIPDWTEFFLLHESHHIYTIYWLRSELKN